MCELTNLPPSFDCNLIPNSKQRKLIKKFKSCSLLGFLMVTFLFPLVTTILPNEKKKMTMPYCFNYKESCSAIKKMINYTLGSTGLIL